MTPRLHVVGAPAPAVSTAGRKLLRELTRMEGPLKDALFEFNVALARDDVEAGISCVRRLVAIGGCLRDAANEAGADL